MSSGVTSPGSPCAPSRELPAGDRARCHACSSPTTCRRSCARSEPERPSATEVAVAVQPPPPSAREDGPRSWRCSRPANRRRAAGAGRTQISKPAAVDTRDEQPSRPQQPTHLEQPGRPVGEVAEHRGAVDKVERAVGLWQRRQRVAGVQAQRRICITHPRDRRLMHVTADQPEAVVGVGSKPASTRPDPQPKSRTRLPRHSQSVGRAETMSR
jgi:hypothetical protein